MANIVVALNTFQVSLIREAINTELKSMLDTIQDIRCYEDCSDESYPHSTPYGSMKEAIDIKRLEIKKIGAVRQLYDLFMDP
jgi:hypothetical protein